MNQIVEGSLFNADGSSKNKFRNQFHTFTLDKTTNLFFSLTNLKRDLDLYVTSLDSDGKPPTSTDGKRIFNIASSTNDKTEDELIFLQLKKGTYRAEIKENTLANAWAEDSKRSEREEHYSYTLELDGTTFDETTTLSNDPYLSYQWYLFNTGLLSEKLVDSKKNLKAPVSTPNADIRAPEAWNLGTDGSGVTLAIIDGGVDLEHPDLKDNLWRNEGEIPGNGEDDDNNGFKDDIHGWNFQNNNATPKKSEHGTHVAGIAAASGNNGIGISGVAWNAKIMSLDVFPVEGGADDKNIINALYYAVDNGAKVINMSLGMAGKISPLDFLALKDAAFIKAYRKAFSYARKNDVFIAIAAGNSGRRAADINQWNNVGDLDTYASIPALFSREFSNIATVISTDSNNEKTDYSNYGQSATIAAPGGDKNKIIDLYVPDPGESGEKESVEVNFGILSTVPVGTGDARFEGNYDFLQGTSMASPVIAGMATLIRSANASITAQDTLAILRAGATAKPGLVGSVKGGLTANLENSLLIAENWTGPSDLLKVQQSEETPVVNLSFLDQGALGVTGTTTVTRNAAFDPITGFYKAVDAFGSVYDSLGNLVRPGDSTYAEIALNEKNIVSSISNVSIGDKQSTTNNFEIKDSAFLAPFALVNGNTWFAFKEANSDNFAHFKLLGDNRFGLEDLKGGGDQDFNDHTITFKVDALI